MRACVDLAHLGSILIFYVLARASLPSLLCPSLAGGGAGRSCRSRGLWSRARPRTVVTTRPKYRNWDFAVAVGLEGGDGCRCFGQRHGRCPKCRAKVCISIFQTLLIYLFFFFFFFLSFFLPLSLLSLRIFSFGTFHFDLICSSAYLSERSPWLESYKQHI